MVFRGSTKKLTMMRIQNCVQDLRGVERIQDLVQQAQGVFKCVQDLQGVERSHDLVQAAQGVLKCVQYLKVVDRIQVPVQ